jgi:serine/threonine-protein kinase RsbW
MTTTQPRCFDARIERFQEVRGFIERFCADAGVGYRESARLVLILEELFANTVVHGYPGVHTSVAEWPIWLTLTAAIEGIETVYEDAAVAYDPFATVAMPDYSGSAENWRVGGLGIILVTKLGRDLRYERTGGRNRICFTLPILQREP